MTPPFPYPPRDVRLFASLFFFLFFDKSEMIDDDIFFHLFRNNFIYKTGGVNSFFVSQRCQGGGDIT